MSKSTLCLQTTAAVPPHKPRWADMEDPDEEAELGADCKLQNAAPQAGTSQHTTKIKALQANGTNVLLRATPEVHCREVEGKVTALAHQGRFRRSPFVSKSHAPVVEAGTGITYHFIGDDRDADDLTTLVKVDNVL